MKYFLMIYAVAISIAALVGCSGSSTNDITMLPVVWADTSPSKSVVVADTQIASWSAEYNSVLAPVVTGFRSNLAGLGQGDSFTSIMLGQIVTTTISKSGSDVIFDGVFSDQNDSHGHGFYKLTLHKNTQSFDFTQTVIYERHLASDNSLEDYMLVVTDMSGATVFGDGSYTGYGHAYAYDYTTGGTGWNAWTGYVLSNGGFYGLKTDKCLDPTGNNAWLPSGTHSGIPMYDDSTLISNMKMLVPAGSYKCLAYKLGATWAIELNSSSIDALWTQYAK